jgi:hypothetical protein
MRVTDGLPLHHRTQRLRGAALARDFYLHLLPELEPSPTDDLHLVLLMKDIRRTLRP